MGFGFAYFLSKGIKILEKLSVDIGNIASIKATVDKSFKALKAL